MAIDDLLVEAGSFRAVTIDDVISAAGVARSTFYRYFDDKAELLLELSGSAVEEVIEAANRLLGSPTPSTREELLEVARETVAVFVRHRPLLLALSEQAATDPRAAATLRRSFGRAHQQASERIAAAQERGAARREIDADAVAGWLTWMAERGMHQLIGPADAPERERLETGLADIIWFTVFAR